MKVQYCSQFRPSVVETLASTAFFNSMGSHFPVVELDNANRFSNGLDPFKGASIPVA